MNETSQIISRTAEANALDRPIESQTTPHSYNYGVDPNADNQIHLLDYWRAIRKRLWLVISVVVLVTMLAVVYMARKPDIYQADARVQVDLENNSALLGKTPYFLGSPNDPVYFNTQLQILTSPGLIRRVVKTLDLEHNPDFLKGQGSKRSTWQTVLKMVGWSSNEKPQAVVPVDELTLTNTAPATATDDLKEAKRLAPFVGAIQGGLKVEPVRETRGGFNKETRLISLSFTHTDSQVAAKVVNAVADTFVYQNLQKKNETNLDTSTFLTQRIADLQNQIRQDEEKLVNYAKNHEITSLDANQNTVVDRLAGLNRQLLEAENSRKEAESALNATKAPGAALALVDGDPKSTGGDDGKLADLKQKRAQLLVDATEEAPEVKEINEQIQELEKQQKDSRGRRSSNLLLALETKYRQALAYEESLRKAFNQQRGETLTQNEAAINYHIIQQEIETYKSLLTNLLQRSKENDVVMATKANNISIVDHAITPDGPVGPNRMRGVFLAMILSLGLGTGLALLLEYMDDTVHSTEEVERLLHLPALAVIPAVAPAARRRALAATPTALEKRNGNASTNPELLMNVDGRSPLAESYRHLRTSVLLSTAGRAPRALLVTSSLPGEGKTTTAVNTALSLAQTNASVVIVDADMRRPRLRSIFGLQASAGLSSILSSDMTDEEMISLVHHDPNSELNILTSGPIPPNPAELLGSNQMRRLVTALQKKYAHVVIDSPPIASFTDGVLISTMVDGVLLVVHGGKSSRHVVRRSRQLLQDVGAKIFGVVLNNINLQAHDYYYYQRYYSQNYYKTDAETEETSRAASA
ncbi:MAG TPA: polysaccharide biosynthesis tyrosine autokinase [Pyrinomonadaceae bacterium]|nr:polysaccharide biosynthesis tyrosine autokinase [Pyrinomonadaceae bacterium]